MSYEWRRRVSYVDGVYVNHPSPPTIPTPPPTPLLLQTTHGLSPLTPEHRITHIDQGIYRPTYRYCIEIIFIPIPPLPPTPPWLLSHLSGIYIYIFSCPTQNILVVYIENTITCSVYIMRQNFMPSARDNSACRFMLITCKQ